MPATNTHAPALRATYLLAFDNFSTDPSEVASLPEVGNVRYARELLGLLVQAGLLSEQDVNGEEIVWQVATPGTYDTATREQAVTEIDGYLGQFDGKIPGPIKANRLRRQAVATKRNPAGLPLCLCGCGTPGKSDYRPGHDARHAGNLARAVLSGEMTFATASKGLSEALANKVAAQVERGNTKVTTGKGKTTPKRPARKPLLGRKVNIKIGRWIYTGVVSSTTVDANGRENADSEVVAIAYWTSKGEEKHAQVDSSAFKGAWEFAD